MTLKPCLTCGEPSEATRCPDCRPKDTRPRDRVTRTNNARWKNLSRRLRRQQPFCTWCSTTHDLTVDHIIELEDGGEPYALDNLQVLCRSCNTRKTRGDATPRGNAPTPRPRQRSDAETEALLAAADLVTLARTAVEYDYRGDVIDAHAPEMPTRFAKQLTQILRGAVAIGVDRTDALRLAVRGARDSMPPLRLAIVDDISANPDSTTAEVRKRLQLPRATVDRQLQALDMLGVLAMDEEEGLHRGQEVTRWRYRIADGIDPAALDWSRINARYGTTTPHTPRKRDQETCSPQPPPAITGTETGCPLHSPPEPDICWTCEQAVSA